MEYTEHNVTFCLLEALCYKWVHRANYPTLKWLHYCWWVSHIILLCFALLWRKIIEDQMARWIFAKNLKVWGNCVTCKLYKASIILNIPIWYSKFSWMGKGEGDGIKLGVRGSLLIALVWVHRKTLEYCFLYSSKLTLLATSVTVKSVSFKQDTRWFLLFWKVHNILLSL